MQYGSEDAVIKTPEASAARPRLLDEVRARLRVKHYSLRTEQAYLYWIRRYIHSHDRRHPRELDDKHVEHFLSELARRYWVAPSTQNPALVALLFLYRDVLAVDLPCPAAVLPAHPSPMSGV